MPSFLIDITGYDKRKREAILAYESQVIIPGSESTLIDNVEAANRHFGTRIGVRAAEAFFTREPIGLTDLSSLTMPGRTILTETAKRAGP